MDDFIHNHEYRKPKWKKKIHRKKSSTEFSNQTKLNLQFMISVKKCLLRLKISTPHTRSLPVTSSKKADSKKLDKRAK